MFSTKLWEWYVEGLDDGKVKRRDITITQYSSYFSLPARWYHAKNAYPVSWHAADLKADSNQLALESLELAFDTLEVEKWSLINFAAKFVPI